MPSEDSPDTLPGIIKSLAQQLSSRDAQLQVERVKFSEELSEMKKQHDTLQMEHDCGLRSLEEVKLQRNQLKEELRSVRAAWTADLDGVRARAERDMERERALHAKALDDSGLEKAELTKKIELLEQAISHQQKIVAQTRRESIEWETRYISATEEARRLEDKWTAQLSYMVQKIDELVAERHHSDPGLSPTVVTSVSPNKDSTIKSQQHADGLTQLVNMNNNAQGSLPGPPRIMVHASPSRLANVIPEAKETILSLPRPPQAQITPISPQKGSPSLITSLASQSSLPADRVIVTAHYEIKEEEDEEGPSSHGNGTRHSATSQYKYEGNSGDESEVPLTAKRKRLRTRKRSLRSIVDEDEQEQVGEVIRCAVKRQRQDPDDSDEMAIGAEDNLQEIYGYRRVNIHELGSELPSHFVPSRTVVSLDGSGDKHKTRYVPATPNKRPVLTRIGKTLMT
ncbi:hypothetical protein K439DRAFT_1662243 [Ramaria rubella]|nr:hypothetical protein K439DRAFT_1662243 [Ramaria rubella]